MDAEGRMIVFSKLTDYLDSFLEMGIPGYDCIVYHHGKCVYRHMNGYSDRERKIPVSGKERYFVYSCSKVVTCVAALQLYERGMFGLDDKLSEYMPEFETMYVKTPDGVKKAERSITIRDLFRMTAGFNYQTLGTPWLEEAGRRTEGKFSTRETIRCLAEAPLDFEPGTAYQYSLCHDVLAALVEVISGERFSDYVKAHIFEPLGMDRSSYHVADDALGDLAQQYSYDPKLKQTELFGKRNQGIFGPKYDSGGAGCISTVEDYIKFLEALRVGDLILKRETIDLMATNQLSAKQLKEFARGDYGYGLGVRCPRDGSVTDFGWAGAAGAYLAIDRINDITVYYAQHLLMHPNYREDIIEYVKEALHCGQH